MAEWLCFAGHVLDVARRELRREHDGKLINLQPQIFDLLVYLIEQRARVVGKEELLDAIWPDTAVTDGSLQRAISLARDAVGHDSIRTHARRGYRFVADVTLRRDHTSEPLGAAPRYLRRGDVHLAYRVLGGGADVDLLVIPGWAFPMSAWAGLARLRDTLAAMGRLGRVILFDKRGVGLSDPIKQTPSLEERMEDARAVLDAVGARRAIVLGISEGAPMALLMAASHPARVRGLLLVGAFARLGWDEARVDQLRGYIEGRWGEGATMRAMVPRHADDPEVVAWAPAAELDGASPGAALDLVETNLGIDASALVPQVRVPATVLHQTNDPIVPVECGRELGERLPGARYLERPGDDHAFVFDGADVLLTELAGLIERTADDDATVDEDRFLTTALVAEDAGAEAESALRRFGAQAVDRLGSRLSACFDGPARAVRCARALGARRVGVHTGEVVRELSGKIGGPALERALELLGEAGADEIRVSRIVRDLIGDSDVLAGIRIS